ncbi:hypothetical protein GCM10009854_12520 [Saccharopolyspora halophila]|uniref:Uncharacterized protein n=1 Tax=Saccharopolyspora halophila TaxID=405551 RepID=A0ABP5STN3_9PSEU
MSPDAGEGLSGVEASGGRGVVVHLVAESLVWITTRANLRAAGGCPAFVCDPHCRRDVRFVLQWNFRPGQRRPNECGADHCIGCGIDRARSPIRLEFPIRLPS